MIIQFVLISIFLIACSFAFTRRKKAPIISVFIITQSCIGMILVIFPAITQTLADWVGVSRGVDLITYLFMAIMMMVLLDIYLKLHTTLEMLAATARRLSLLEANIEDKQK